MIALIKLSPMIVLGGLMMSGMDILLAAPIAFIIATIIAMLTDRFSFSTLLDAGLENMKYYLIVDRKSAATPVAMKHSATA